MDSVDLGTILACPRCRHSVTIGAAENAVECRECRLRFPLVDQIPVMLVESAQAIN